MKCDRCGYEIAGTAFCVSTTVKYDENSFDFLPSKTYCRTCYEGKFGIDERHSEGR